MQETLRSVALILAVAVSITVFLIGDAGAQTTNEKLRIELLAMREQDQKARGECSGNADEQLKCFIRVSETVDKPNTKRINAIFQDVGFPSNKGVGRDGVEAFYLLLQHSNDLALKQKCLPGIKRAFSEKVMSASDYANFTDRLLVNLGKRQIYGANFDMKDGKLVMSPTVDPKNLDKRRKSIGLPPIAEYVKLLQEAYKLEVVTGVTK